MRQTDEKSKRIGLFGGSFNPPTLAHKALADFVFSTLDLDMLLWVVAPHNPEKDPATLAPFRHRFEMVRRVLQDTPGMTPSDIEERNGSSWTIDTVRALRRDYPDQDLFLVIGADNWLRFHTWGDGFDEILSPVSIAIMQRPGFDLTVAPSSGIFRDLQVSGPAQLKKANSWCFVENPLIDMAATQAREALKAGRTPDGLAPETLAYIRENGLYSS